METIYLALAEASECLPSLVKYASLNIQNNRPLTKSATLS